MSEPIFKIMTSGQWREARQLGRFTGAPVDRADGFIHFSTRAQVAETAARHFAGQPGLMLVAVDPQRCPARRLVWEPSRGGDLFPHLYADLDMAWVVRTDPLPLDNGTHRFPDWLTTGEAQ